MNNYQEEGAMDEAAKNFITERLREAHWRAVRAGNAELAADLDVLVFKVRGRGLRDEEGTFCAPVRWLFDYHTDQPVRPATAAEVVYWTEHIARARSRWILIEHSEGVRAVVVGDSPRPDERP